MNRLFAKIFLGFWLTTIAVVVATALVAIQINRSRDDDSLRAYFQRTQSAYAQAASSILDTQGLGELRLWMSELQGPGGVHGHLQVLDDAGRAVFGPPAAADIRAALVARDSGVASPAMLKGVFFDPLYGLGGERYWFVSDMRRSAKMGKLLALRGPGFGGGYRLGIAILVSGLVCYLLARYLTIPIRRLQAASAEIANGNFSARVDTAGRRDELGDLGRDFDRMAEHLERLEASHQQLLRDVSHELRSPLARLHIALGLARQHSGNEVGAELDRIEHEAQVLEELIRQLLSVARLESGVAQLPHEDVAIDELIQAVAQDANYEGANEGKSVLCRGRCDMLVRGERTLLKSAFENVVRNALTHTRPNTTVEIVVELEDNHSAVIRISDQGPGVEQQLLGELFKPFVRGDYSRDRKTGGYGIGLAIAEASIRRHGGSIEAKNLAGAGLCVEIRLPQSIGSNPC